MSQGENIYDTHVLSTAAPVKIVIVLLVRRNLSIRSMIGFGRQIPRFMATLSFSSRNVCRDVKFMYRAYGYYDGVQVIDIQFQFDIIHVIHDSTNYLYNYR